MTKAVIFGGTTEGRMLCEDCARRGIAVLYCAATPDGARPVEALPGTEVMTGRLESAQMARLLAERSPALVVDATHPYAIEASRNIEAACHSAGAPLLRVSREGGDEPGGLYFSSVSDLTDWLEVEPGGVFVTMGSSCAADFSRLADYRNRVWMRILPSMDSLRACLELGYRPERLICMHGPFSQELNRAMFKASGARILVTKNSGAPGGFGEKLRAAQSLGMLTAVLSKPKASPGVPLEEARRRIMELCV